MKKYVGLLLIMLVAVVNWPSDSQARGRVFVGGGVVVGSPYYAYPPYYGYPYYNYPPAYYPPPPAYEPPPPTPSSRYYHDDSGEYCREFTHPIVIDGVRHQGYGHACQQPDGSWHIVD